MSVAAQSKLIEEIPNLRGLQGWLLCGPPGTSKTTYLSVAVRDYMTTLAAARGSRWYSTESLLNIWRINVPDWLARIQKWDTRDFSDKKMKEPEDSIDNILARTDYREPWMSPPDYMRGPLVIWLEELDKCSYTKTRADYLFRLVEQVYAREGLILATSNMTPAELEEHLGSAIYRRIAGTNESAETAERFKVWDLYRGCTKATGLTKSGGTSPGSSR
jgi:hypothetical protein